MEQVEHLVSRKARREEEKRRRSRQFIKGTALVGTTLTACSLVTPLMQPIATQAATQQRAAVTNTSAFIAEIATYAQPVAQKNDLFASVMIAQAILESGWGKSALSQAPNYNLFGIKGVYQGQSVTMSTQEYLNGRWVTMNEPFRKYPSYQQSFEDNAYVLRNVVMGGQYYYRGAWKSNCSSYREATAWLTGRYATAPNYASSLNSVIANYNLTRFDSPATGNAGGGANTGSSNNVSDAGSTNSSNTSNKPSTTTNSTYTVKSGDSVWLIAHNHGITMNQLITWNNIKNNLIFPGQKLIVKKSSTSNTGSSTNNQNNSSSNQGNSTNNSANATTNKPSTSTSSSYTVKSGDSVWLIAHNHGISMNQLIAWNNIKNNFIYPGQKLVVKKATSNANTGSTNQNTSSNQSNSSNQTGSTSKPSTSTSGSYTVKSGDSVWLVAHNHGISMTQLVSWNNIKNNFIYPGQKLVVKKASTSSNQTNNSATNTSNKPSNTNSSGTNNNATSSGNSYYTVKAGESVWSIADKNNITMDQLIAWNGIKNNFVYPGQKVIVKKYTTTTNNTPSNNAANKTYQVKSGDSLWDVATKYNLTITQLKQLNNLQTDIIYVGQKLKVKI